MMAAKNDPIWRAINRFGNPWPPFDFNSGVGLRDVDRTEAEDMGGIDLNEVIDPEDESINEKLEAPVNAREGAWLKQMFGNRVKVENGMARWVPPSDARAVVSAAPKKTTLPAAWVEGVNLNTIKGLEKALARTADDAPKSDDKRENDLWEQALLKLIEVPKKKRSRPLIKPSSGVPDNIIAAAWAGAQEITRFVHPRSC